MSCSAFYSAVRRLQEKRSMQNIITLCSSDYIRQALFIPQWGNSLVITAKDATSTGKKNQTNKINEKQNRINKILAKYKVSGK